jgi:ribosomal protein S27AE
MVSQSPVKIICGRCGSEEVLKDAYAEWDVKSQSWVLHSTYDDNRCGHCDYDGNDFQEVPVEGAKENTGV